MNRMAAFVLVALIGLGVPSAPAVEPRDSGGAAGTVQIIDWKNLMPAGYDPVDVIRGYHREVAKLKYDDPRTRQLSADLRKAWENAPVVESLNNKMVKLSGFVVSLEGDGKAVSEFLLVPFFGACIHVPPPPSNQIVLVRTGKKPLKINQMFDMISVTGRLRTERASTDLASVSYVIEAALVEPHKP